MQFLHTREWETIDKRMKEERKIQRNSFLKKDANPNPDYRLPHEFLLLRKRKK